MESWQIRSVQAFMAGGESIGSECSRPSAPERANILKLLGVRRAKPASSNVSWIT
jgi:hypothetical protein